jgi:hypothetical protein
MPPRAPKAKRQTSYYRHQAQGASHQTHQSVVVVVCLLCRTQKLAPFGVCDLNSMHLNGNRRILHKVCGSLCDALPLVFACIELVLDRCRSAARLAALSFDARDARMRGRLIFSRCFASCLCKMLYSCVSFFYPKYLVLQHGSSGDHGMGGERVSCDESTGAHCARLTETRACSCFERANR